MSKFWSTQPINRMDKSINEMTHDQHNDLGELFEWSDVDVSNNSELDDLYKLLHDHYINNDKFMLDYSKDFLQWTLTPPEWKKELLLGVRVKSNKKLVAFIAALPVTVSVNHVVVRMVEINFLCVHDKLRSKRLTPLLSKEIIRRMNNYGISQGVCTISMSSPTQHANYTTSPLSTCSYWHRQLNPKKLSETGFTKFGPDHRHRTMTHKHYTLTLPRAIKLYKIPDKTKIPGIRPMQEKDIKQVKHLLNRGIHNHMSHRYDTHDTRQVVQGTRQSGNPSDQELRQIFSTQEVRHLLPKENVITSYVVENENKITDFISFYILSMRTISNHTSSLSNVSSSNSTYLTNTTSTAHLVNVPDRDIKNGEVKGAYSFYNVSTRTPIKDLISDAMIIAQSQGLDVYNCLDTYNEDMLKSLKFVEGNGKLNYYIYNYDSDKIPKEKISLYIL